MGHLTTDPNDPRLGHGVDAEPRAQHEVYLVLSEEERAKGFVRPYRDTYVHVGPVGPAHPLRDLTDEERAQFSPYGYVKFEPYPASEAPLTGRFWTQAQLDAVGKGCGVVTRMGRALSETYARNPRFYGATYCVGCQKHLAVAEFVWDGTNERVGS
jgi:hypothetical protein